MATLASVDKRWQPQLDGSEIEKGEEGFPRFVIAGGDTAELLEPVEHPFDTISVTVSAEIAGNVLCPVRTWRDYGKNTSKKQVLPYPVTIIPLVGQKSARCHDRQVHQGISTGIIRNFTTRQVEAKRASLTVRTGVDLARKAAAASTKAFLMSPPFAPVAWL